MQSSGGVTRTCSAGPSRRTRQTSGTRTRIAPTRGRCSVKPGSSTPVANKKPGCKRRLQVAVIVLARVPLLKDAVHKVSVGMVGRVEVPLQTDDCRRNLRRCRHACSSVALVCLSRSRLCAIFLGISVVCFPRPLHRLMVLLYPFPHATEGCAETLAQAGQTLFHPRRHHGIDRPHHKPSASICRSVCVGHRNLHADQLGTPRSSSM